MTEVQNHDSSYISAATQLCGVTGMWGKTQQQGNSMYKLYWLWIVSKTEHWHFRMCYAHRHKREQNAQRTLLLKLHIVTDLVRYILYEQEYNFEAAVTLNRHVSDKNWVINLTSDVLVSVIWKLRILLM